VSAAAAVLLTAAQAASAMAGHLIAGPGSAATKGFSIDTRTLIAGEVYFAIIGERLDGHRFVREALQAGASGLVVSDPSSVPPSLDPAVVVVRVDDTTRALQRLAKHIRHASGSQVVAITGSAGKTTTKEITAELSGRGTACSATTATSTTTSGCRSRCSSFATGPRSRSSNSA